MRRRVTPSFPPWLRPAHQETDQERPEPTHELLRIAYAELRELARRKLSQERPGHTLQATALVHEAWLRLSVQHDQVWANRRHFFAAAAEAMRRILIDSARRRNALRRGGDLRRTDFHDKEISGEEPADSLLDLDAALLEFEKIEPAKAELVRLRFYAGLTLEDAAQISGISLATAKRHWRFSKAWLYARIAGQDAENSAGTELF